MPKTFRPMIGLFAELAARQQSAGLVLPRVNFVIAKRPGDAIERDPILRKKKIKVTQSRTFRIPVELGSKRLTAFIAGRNLNMRTWGVDMTLISPSGTVFGAGSPQLRVDSHYLYVNVIAPEAGDWTLVAKPNASEAQYATALAFVDNPRPKLHVDVRPRIISAGAKTTATAAVSYMVDLDPNAVTVDGFLTDPTGARRYVTFTPGISGGWSTEVTGLVINGLYRLDVEAEVTNGAEVMRGEPIFDGPERAPVRVEPFRRFATASFLVVNGRDKPCDQKDCDGDGIPNGTECKGFPKDIDKDGIPNYRDEDSDNDQVPDAIEGLRDRNENDVPDMCEPGPKRDTGRDQLDIPRLMERQKEIMKLLCSNRIVERLASELAGMSSDLNRAITAKRPSRKQEAKIRPLLKEVALRLHKLTKLVDAGRAECRVVEELLVPVLEIEERILQILR